MNPYNNPYEYISEDQQQYNNYRNAYSPYPVNHFVEHSEDMPVVYHIHSYPRPSLNSNKSQPTRYDDNFRQSSFIDPQYPRRQMLPRPNTYSDAPEEYYQPEILPRPLNPVSSRSLYYNTPYISRNYDVNEPYEYQTAPIQNYGQYKQQKMDYRPNYSIVPESPNSLNEPSKDETPSIANLLNGLEKRVVVMVRNIPNRYKEEDLKRVLDMTSKDLFKIIHLPYDTRTKKNLGYAFIRFFSPEALTCTMLARHGKLWPNSNSLKKCMFYYAQFQNKSDEEAYLKSKTSSKPNGSYIL